MKPRMKPVPATTPAKDRALIKAAKHDPESIYCTCGECQTARREKAYWGKKAEQEAANYSFTTIPESVKKLVQPGNLNIAKTIEVICSKPFVWSNFLAGCWAKEGVFSILSLKPDFWWLLDINFGPLGHPEQRIMIPFCYVPVARSSPSLREALSRIRYYEKGPGDTCGLTAPPKSKQP